MKLVAHILVLVCGFGFSALTVAHAEDDLAGGDKPYRALKLSPEACRELAPYIPGGADYQPGVAADGSPVAPADLNGGWPAPRQIYSFPVEIEPLRRSHRPYARSRLEVANLTFDVRTGRVTLDGQDISGGNRALAEACAYQATKPQD
jgi:hypothetical protein